MYFLAHFYIKILKNITKILIIIQRSNGDVFLSSSLIKSLYEYFIEPEIDLLVNDDTVAIAKLIPSVNYIHTFSYKKKKEKRWNQERKIILNLYKKYDLSVNLTASDRSVLYAIMSGKKSISAIENKRSKSWWKKIFLTQYYYFNSSNHILKNNLEALSLLNIKAKNIHYPVEVSEIATLNIKKKLQKFKVKDFLIFHPSTQYQYKVYPTNQRNNLLSRLNDLGLSILVTGGSNSIDEEIKNQLPSFSNVIDFIGETSLEEFFALSELSLGFIGMDTLNMHIAASQNKRIFAIFGPTNLKMWSPWSNQFQQAATIDKPKQTYGNITIFQADMPCVACGKAGCKDDLGYSDCLDNISPKVIFNEVEQWYKNKNENINESIPIKTESNERKILLYIVYGEDQSYYDGAIFSFLTFKNWMSDTCDIEVVVLTEKPDVFEHYPVKIFSISQKQKNEWSLNGKYHFRIKNRGMAHIMDQLELKKKDKILFLDADTYFHKSPLPLFDLIQPNQALFYLNEGLIYKRKRFQVYIDYLEGKTIQIDNEVYKLSKDSAMWGSLMVGIMPNMRSSLEWADKLMQVFIDIVPAHTIEPFSLAESLLKKYKMIEGKKYVSLYSTSRKKLHATIIIAEFLNKIKELPIDKKIYLAQKVIIKRSALKVIKQRISHLLR
jgi:heptosyltransferase III